MSVPAARVQNQYGTHICLCLQRLLLVCYCLKITLILFRLRCFRGDTNLRLRCWLVCDIPKIYWWLIRYRCLLNLEKNWRWWRRGLYNCWGLNLLVLYCLYTIENYKWRGLVGCRWGGVGKKGWVTALIT